MKHVLVLLLVAALLPACRSSRNNASLGGVYVTGEIAKPVRAAQDFLVGHPDLLTALGSPFGFGGMGADIRPGLQKATVTTKASGPGGSGPVAVSLIEEHGRWKAVSGELTLGDRVVALRPR